MRLHYYFPPDNASELEGCPTEDDGGYGLAEVKRLIKEYGGTGRSCHCGRDGEVYGWSEIKVKGRNSVRMSTSKEANYTS